MNVFLYNIIQFNIRRGQSYFEGQVKIFTDLDNVWKNIQSRRFTPFRDGFHSPSVSIRAIIISMDVQIFLNIKGLGC